jgi:hypothetical protein
MDFAISPKRRSPRISACRTINHDGWLMQWNYSQEFKRSNLSSFVSIISPDDKPGLWIDAPYHCYGGGPHRYRRIPRGLALHIYICCIRGWIHDRLSKLEHRIYCARVSLKVNLRYYSIEEVRRRRRTASEWKKFLNDLGQGL